MIIYNVTTNVSKDIEADWLIWMKEDHISKVVKKGDFEHALLTKVLVDEEMGGVTYSTQYASPDRKTLDYYLQHYAPELMREVFEKFGEKLVSFRTELEVIELIENTNIK